MAITSARKRKSTEPSGKYTTNHLRRSGQANSEMGDIKCCSKVDCLSTEQEREREGEGGGGGCFITLPGRVALKAHGKLAPFYVAHTQACLGALKYSVFCFCRGLEGRKEGGGERGRRGGIIQQDHFYCYIVRVRGCEMWMQQQFPVLCLHFISASWLVG